MNWDEYLMKIAQLVATKSKDPSTKAGCVIVGPNNEIRSTGFNGFPRRIDETDPKRWERPTKYQFAEHAERNAIYNAARHGAALDGCIAYITGDPCADCARGLIQAGIQVIVIPKDNPFRQRADWAESCGNAQAMLKEAGVTVIEL